MVAAWTQVASGRLSLEPLPKASTSSWRTGGATPEIRAARRKRRCRRNDEERPRQSPRLESCTPAPSSHNVSPLSEASTPLRAHAPDARGGAGREWRAMQLSLCSRIEPRGSPRRGEPSRAECSHLHRPAFRRYSVITCCGPARDDGDDGIVLPALNRANDLRESPVGGKNRAAGPEGGWPRSAASTRRRDPTITTIHRIPPTSSHPSARRAAVTPSGCGTTIAASAPINSRPSCEGRTWAA